MLDFNFKKKLRVAIAVAIFISIILFSVFDSDALSHILYSYDFVLIKGLPQDFLSQLPMAKHFGTNGYSANSPIASIPNENILLMFMPSYMFSLVFLIFVIILAIVPFIIIRFKLQRRRQKLEWDNIMDT